MLGDSARALEVSFLAEMLKSSGLHEPSGFSGGPGESHFTSFLLRAQAEQMVDAGGLGLAEHFADSLARGAT